jgi:hypothetical protein
MSYGNTVKDGSGSFYHNLCDVNGRLIVSRFDTFVVSDVTADDSDKSFTVPANYIYIIYGIRVTLTTTASAGNRNMAVTITDGTNVLCEVRAGIVQTASLARYYTFSQDVPELTAYRDTDYLSTLIPSFPLPVGYVVRVYDRKAIDVAADDMLVHITFGRMQV